MVLLRCFQFEDGQKTCNCQLYCLSTGIRWDWVLLDVYTCTRKVGGCFKLCCKIFTNNKSKDLWNNRDIWVQFRFDPIPPGSEPRIPTLYHSSYSCSIPYSFPFWLRAKYPLLVPLLAPLLNPLLHLMLWLAKRDNLTLNTFPIPSSDPSFLSNHSIRNRRDMRIPSWTLLDSQRIRYRRVTLIPIAHLRFTKSRTSEPQDVPV